MSTSGGGNANNNTKGSDRRGQKSNDWPRTVDEAVDRILRGMSDANKQRLRAMSKDDLIDLHFSMGIGIRNNFGLWQGNAALMKSCAEAAGYGSDALFIEPDEASEVIIEAVWRRLQNEQ